MMKKKRYKKVDKLASALGLDKERGHLSEIKAKLTFEIIKIMKQQNLTHQEVALLSDIPRTAITGIVNGSLQMVTLDRLVRILVALGKHVEVKVKSAA